MPLLAKKPKKKTRHPPPLGGKRPSGRRPRKPPKGVGMVGTPLPQPPPTQPPHPPVDPNGSGGPPVYGRDLGNAQLKRLLWRAGFGPRPGQVDALAGQSLEDVVHSLTRPSGAPTFNGPE